MDRISMQVTVVNASDATLQLNSSNLNDGDWTNGKGAPGTIAPGASGYWEGEGHLAGLFGDGVATTGTDGVVIYDIHAPGIVGQLYIRWDSPLIDSQYENKFWIWGPVGWEVGYTGGQGHNASLNIRLRRTALRQVPNFDPRVRGFGFVNHWSSSLPAVKLGFVLKTLYSNNACVGGVASDIAQSVIDVTTAGIAPLAVAAMSEDWGPTLTTAKGGLCGGMTYAVMDYYYAHLLPPVMSSSPTSADDPLYLYIRQRQMDSYDFEGQGCRFLMYPLSVYPNGDEGFVQTVGLWKGRSWVSYREAWPQIQADIDAGRLSPMGLIRNINNNLAVNHQVLAYGYERSAQDVTLYITDPNWPQHVVTYAFNIEDTTGEVHLTQTVEGGPATDPDDRVYCFFRINNYNAAAPPEGRRFQSVRAAVEVATGAAGASLRQLMGGQTSVIGWLRSV